MLPYICALLPPTPQLSSWAPSHLAIPFISSPFYLYRSSPASRRLLLLYLPPPNLDFHLSNHVVDLSLSLVVYAAVKGPHVVARDRQEKEKEGDRTSVNDQSQSTAILALHSCPPLCSFLDTSTTQKPTRGIYDFDPELPFTPSQTRFGMSNSLSIPIYPIAKLLLPYYLILRIPKLHTAPVAEDSTLSLPTYQASIPS